MQTPDSTANSAPGAGDLTAIIQGAARDAVQDALEKHRRLGQRIAVQKAGEGVRVDAVENILSENEQTPPHVA